MLGLQITRRHVRLGFDRFGRILHTVFEIILIDDLKREGVEDYLFEFFVDACWMIDGDEAHFFREWEIKIDDTTMRAVTSPIIDITIRANTPPGMRTIQFLELLIHNGRRMRMATAESLP